MTRLLLLALSLTLAAGTADARPPGWAPLLEPLEVAAIAAATPELRSVRVSGEHAAGHVPGSLDAPYARWRGPAENPGALPPTEALGALVRELGLTPDTPVVVVHDGTDATDMGTATRVYWTLKSVGIRDLAVLNGGFRGWADAGLPVAKETRVAAPSAYVPRFDDTWRVTTAEVEAMVAAGTDVPLIDARPEGFFAGRLWTVARPGTIRGARSLTFETWFDGARMRPVEELRALAAELAPTGGAVGTPGLVSFCNTGHWASINWFVLSEVTGIPGTRLYAESMAEWAASGGALDNAPNRVTYYWRVTRNWVDATF